MASARRRGIRIMIRAIMIMAEEALYHLLSWLSPSYPIGAFSHSTGLEWAVEAGLARDRASVEAWIEDMLLAGSGWSDVVLFVHAYRAAARADAVRLLDVAALAAAAQPSYERRLEATAQGAAFRLIARATADCAALQLLEPVEDGDLSYPVTVAALAAGHAIALPAALTAYLHALVANSVSAAQRLIPLGQMDGQRAVAAARPKVAEAVARGLALGDGDPFQALGGSTLMADVSSMLHETQYTRLFRT